MPTRKKREVSSQTARRERKGDKREKAPAKKTRRQVSQGGKNAATGSRTRQRKGAIEDVSALTPGEREIYDELQRLGAFDDNDTAPPTRAASKRRNPTKRRAKVEVEADEEAGEGEPEIRERVLLARELTVRGFWDRYPSSDQKKYPKKYKHIPKVQRRGKTVYDILADDYNSFTLKQRRALTLRVTHGLDQSTGKILTARKIRAGHMDVDLIVDRKRALASLGNFLVRAGAVDTPTGWGVNRKSDTPDPVLIGIEWVVKERVPARRKKGRSRSLMRGRRMR